MPGTADFLSLQHQQFFQKLNTHGQNRFVVEIEVLRMEFGSLSDPEEEKDAGDFLLIAGEIFRCKTVEIQQAGSVCTQSDADGFV